MTQWFMSNWWKVAIVPIAGYLVWKIFKVIVLFFSNRTRPNTAKVDSKFKNDVSSISAEEAKKLEVVNKNCEEAKKLLDSGEKKPCDVFNEELKK